MTLCWFEVYALKKPVFTMFPFRKPQVTKHKISYHVMNNIWRHRKVPQRNLKITQKAGRKREGMSKEGIVAEKGVPPF